MKRPVTSAPLPAPPTIRPGYTLVEILVATALTLIMMGAVVSIFGLISTSVTQSRSTLEMTDRLRAAAARLQSDLAGVTATMLPPRRPEDDEGYFEYIEGEIGPVKKLTDSNSKPYYAVDSDAPQPDNTPDTTVGDIDDILMFTTRSSAHPFVGRLYNYSNSQPGIVSSPEAEVAWFLRGRTLYRRVLLVAPGAGPWTQAQQAGFYAQNDISVHFDAVSGLVANTLGDLTKRENRFAHQSGAFPFSPQNTVAGWAYLRLPTLLECSSATKSWKAGDTLPAINLTKRPAPDSNFDAWRKNPFEYAEVDPATGSLKEYFDPNARITEDVILTHVIGFDVKAWDPGAPIYQNPAGAGQPALVPGDPGYPPSGGSPVVVGYGAYVDLGYWATGYSPAAGAPQPLFNVNNYDDRPVPGPRSRLTRVYDTWSFHYNQGFNQGGVNFTGTGTNGFDDNGDGVVDDPGEMETQAPYPVPLRGIQVKIRAYEPDSRQIREVTVIQDFLPK